MVSNLQEPAGHSIRYVFLLNFALFAQGLFTRSFRMQDGAERHREEDPSLSTTPSILFTICDFR